ncbi:MAG: disulfide bond formation protein DsbA [Curvibacter sp. GWA2_64_110]|nr:MAG: disulfide bond formation protein DsbA [Curvibacter sp. GWA2_64_110]HCY17427.1 disulfide bond formation protein DsbA [Curvibacter sp.]
MKHITFYLDFISPYAHLAFEKLPETLMGLSYSVSYKPVLLGALLKHHGQLGPAEVPAKRDWTYRHVQWLGHQHQVQLQMPSVHPFNPLPLLRLAIAAAGGGDPNRYVCETLLRHVWQGGADALDAARLKALHEQLQPSLAPDDEAVKARLRRNTDEAIAAGVFGVPAYAVDDKLFWGFDALPMLRDYLRGDAWFDGPGWHAVGRIAAGAVRQR